MINDVFHIMRDSKREYKEAAVTESRTGEAIHLLVDRVCNVRIDVEGFTADTTLSVKFEESETGMEFNEIGTFPIPDAHHGILFAKFKPYVRYTLIVGGTDPKLNVNVWF